MDAIVTADVPPGYTPFVPASPFMSVMGPLYQRPGQDNATVLALRVSSIHTNMHGIAHGGMLATLADNALGFNVSGAGQHPIVTVHMSLDFLAPAHAGDWLEAHVSVQKRGGKLSFAECRLMVDGCCILKASGVFSARKRP
ncbi:PaaI family thioesterase [Noviherbaspirillum saxi]|uniref:PaaI family thioesterase n=1 Tax=Noviherbaspirillum saxi TaxID=2320863 RepID=A0A3A3FGL8_9BURK|nr:PaaI family thioesterase [Noviherbaspirillum saxi]RJF92531.1 PaaI family thioesterase [Noviherbaspirillum saxi]